MSERYAPAPEILPVFEDSLSEALSKRGIEFQKFELSDNPVFPEVIILKHKDEPTEKLVRVYRGVSVLNQTALQQTSYALRTLDEDRNVTIIESAKLAVDRLAHEPTMANVYTYVNAALPCLQPKEQESLLYELDEMERHVLSGSTVRKKLINLQMQRNGVIADNGMAPYVSSTFDSTLAAAYARGGVLVIDIPLSEIDGYRVDGEVNIKVDIDPKYISAIIKVNSQERHKREANEDTDIQLQSALEVMNSVTHSSVFSNEELAEVYELKLALERVNDQSRHNEDVEAIQTKIAEKIASAFPDVGLTFVDALKLATRAEISVFDFLSKKVFDMYAERLIKVCRKDRTINNFTYTAKDGYSREERPIDRDAITFSTLEGLRAHALFWEKRAREALG